MSKIYEDKNCILDIKCNDKKKIRFNVGVRITSDCYDEIQKIKIFCSVLVLLMRKY